MENAKEFDFSLFADRQLELLLGQVVGEIARRRSLRRQLHQRGGLVEADRQRYRNPENSSETWSGRGSPPAWFQEALAKGESLESLVQLDDRPMPVEQARKPRSRG